MTAHSAAQIGAGHGSPLAGARALPIPIHVGTSNDVGTLSLPLGPVGTVIGVDRHGAPVALRLAQRRPVHMALIGGEWATSLLAFRALAAGIRIAIHTSAQPGQAWTTLLPWVAASGHRLTIDGRTAAAGFAEAPTIAEPLIEILDGRPDERPVDTPWRTRLTLVRRPADAAAVVPDADATIVQRLTPQDSRIVGAALRAAEETIGLLAQLGDDMLAVIGGEADRYVWLSPTETERRLFGDPTSPASHYREAIDRGNGGRHREERE